MKKHALDIAIVVCAIIVIVLAVILVWPTDKKDVSKSTKVKNEVNSEEKVNEETKEVLHLVKDIFEVFCTQIKQDISTLQQDITEMKIFLK